MFAGFGNPLAPPIEGEMDVDNESMDIRALVSLLGRDILEGQERHLDFTFQEVIDLAHQGDLFNWILDGKEVEGEYVLKRDASVKFGLLLKRYMPRVNDKTGPRFRLWRFNTPDGMKAIRTNCTGKDKHRRFVLELPPKAV
jgi:hypothetical protein